MVCGAKRIRSLYVLLDGKQASRTLYATPLQGRASLDVAKGARHTAQGKKLIPDPRPLTPATFMARSRLGVTPCGADLPASAHSSRLQAALTAFLLRKEDRQIRGRSRWFGHHAG
jgi:hypothetical protein